MKTFVIMRSIILSLLISSIIFSFQGCKKTAEPESADEEISTSRKAAAPRPLSFTNCGTPGFSGNFVMGSPVSVTFTLNYINGPGGSYASFTSTTVNGITITAPSGTLNTGTGSVRFTATGTPVAPGYFIIPVRIGGGNTCNLQILILNPFITVSTGDPGPVIGSTGGVSFNYQNQTVTYKTVRAADEKIWLQQNLGSPKVASNSIDEASYGHFFQWGRWDDGHQLPNSSTIVGNSSLQNPSQIGSGNPGFIKSQSLSLAWWGVGGLSTDTWRGNLPTSANGKNPCTALGAGWRMPTASEWENIINKEGISDTYSAFRSNLKLPAGGVRFFNDGTVHINGGIGYSWTSTADGSNAKAVFIDNAYGLFISATERGNAYPCRCVKD